MELLKDKHFSPKFYQQLAEQFFSIYPSFDKKQFTQAALSNLDQLELKQRLHRTAELSAELLPDNYDDAIAVLFDLCDVLDDVRQNDGSVDGLAYMFMAEFVALYGRDNLAVSLPALKRFTEYGSSEFAIRPFLKDDFNTVISVMRQLSEDDNYHVRRLASEGCRPRLPWSFHLPEVINKPQLTWPILKQLNQDPEKYVHKSVANHINDISKDNAEWLLDELATWDMSNKHTQWIIKHGSRSLIKQGSAGALALFGFTAQPKITVSDISLNKSCIKLGDALVFTVAISSEMKTKMQKLAIDYRIHYVKKSGKTQAKVFKLRETNIEPNESMQLQKKHKFESYSTRQHYTGEHRLELLINGRSVAEQSFMLTCE